MLKGQSEDTHKTEQAGKAPIRRTEGPHGKFRGQTGPDRAAVDMDCALSGPTGQDRVARVRESLSGEWTSIECRHGGRLAAHTARCQCQCRSHSIRDPDVTNTVLLLYSTSVSANKSSDAACHCRDILASGYQGPKRRRHLCASAPLHLPRCMVRSGATDRRASGNGNLLGMVRAAELRSEADQSQSAPPRNLWRGSVARSVSSFTEDCTDTVRAQG